MSLDRAIALAQAAVAADRKGDRSAAKDCFVEAASQLLAVVKAEPDRTKAAKLAQRMESYVARAEQLAAVSKPPPPPRPARRAAPPGARRGRAARAAAGSGGAAASRSCARAGSS